MRQEIGERAGAEAHAPEPATPGRPLPRLGYVDSLRALAALYVVASHIGFTVWPNYVPGGFARQMVTLFWFGHQAVSVFIVLSGFSLMLPVARNKHRLPWGMWGFYERRARRILPPYCLAMSLALLLIWLVIGQRTGTRWDASLPVTGQGILEHLFLVQNFTARHSTINFVFWSIALECQIYLLFPALVLLWRRYPPLFAVAVVFALSLALLNALAAWMTRTPGDDITQASPEFIGLFAMGMFATSVYTAPSPRWTRLRDGRLWDVIALAGAALLVLFVRSQPIFILDAITGLMTVGLLLAASRPGRFNLIRAALEWRPLVWVGGISYSLYLIHAPLIQVLWQYVFHPLGLGDTATFLLLLFIGGPLIVAASWVFWYYCERPFLNTRLSASGRSEHAAPTKVSLAR